MDRDDHSTTGPSTLYTVGGSLLARLQHWPMQEEVGLANQTNQQFLSNNIQPL